jgi:hypothetical protein
MFEKKHLFLATCKMISYFEEEQLGVGTSFFARFKDTLFLFTTHHQLEACTHVKILLLSEKGNKERDTLSIPASMFVKIVNLDLAMCDLTKAIAEKNSTKNLRLKAFVLEDDMDYLNDIDLLDEIFFIGYPSGLIDTQNLTPLMRRCSFSSMYSEDFSGEPTFIIDGSVFPGSSGSPVFHVGEKVSLLGIVTSSMIKQSKHELQYIDLGKATKTKAILALAKAYTKGEFNHV